MRFHHLLLLGCVSAFSSPRLASHEPSYTNAIPDESRHDFLQKAALSLFVPALSLLPSPATARGRATLEQSYDRYAPRIIAGGQFYGTDFRKMIASNDWPAIKSATEDPPKKTKADRSKSDGGVKERAAQAGKFSDARVVVAADLFASTFSDSSITTKTKKLQAEVAVLREVVAGINEAAKEALGEETSGGGMFGFGAKKRSQSELSKAVKELYGKGGNAYNQYCFVVNDGLPLSLEKLPYLK